MAGMVAPLVVFCAALATSTPTLPDQLQYYPLNFEGTQRSSTINQIAILQIPEETKQARSSGEGGCGRDVQEELQRLKDDLEALKTSLITQADEAAAKCVASVREDVTRAEDEATQTESQATLQAPQATMREDVGELQEDLANLQEDITLSKSVVKKDCERDGELQVNDNCSVSECHLGTLRLFQGSSAPNVSFPQLVAKNCIYREETLLTWGAARANCIALGGDLFVAGDFHGLGQYIKNIIHGPWVGIKNRTWIDGRPVSPEEWDEREPSGGSNHCGWMLPKSLKLYDAPCTEHAWHSLCHRGVSYNP